MRRILLRTAIVLTSGVLLVAGTYLTTKLLTATPLAEGCTVETESGETKLDVSQAENASLIAALSVRQDYPPHAATVALATAYQESGLRNLDHGDRDSLGLFQQRPSQGWGSRAQISDPYYSTQTFYDHLMAVEDYDRLPVAEAAQQVQKSADGDAYAQHERNAKALSDAFTGRSEASFSCRLAAEPKPSAYAAAVGSTGSTGSAGSAGSGTAGDGDDASQRSNDTGSQAASAGQTSGQPGEREQDRSTGPDQPSSEPATGDRVAAPAQDAPNGADAYAAAPGDQGSEPSGNSGGSGPTTDGQGPALAGSRPPAGEQAPGSGGTEEAGDTGDGSGTETGRPRSAAEAVQLELQQAFGSRNSSQDASGDDISGTEQPDESEQAGDAEDEAGTSGSAPALPGTPEAPAAPGMPDGQPGTTAGRPTDTDPGGRQPERAANAPATDTEISGDGKQVRVVVDDQEVGWAIAHWSVANTQRFGITEVDYDHRTWSAAKSGDGWVTDEDSPAGEDAVTIGIG